MEINRGDVIKVFIWHGVVKDVFTSTSGRTVIEVYCVKHAMKHQSPELFVLDSIEWAWATLHDLLAERATYQKHVGRRMEEILALYSERQAGAS